MNSINIRFEVSFGTGSEYDAEALQKIQQELATTVKRLQAQYTKKQFLPNLPTSETADRLFPVCPCRNGKYDKSIEIQYCKKLPNGYRPITSVCIIYSSPFPLHHSFVYR